MRRVLGLLLLAGLLLSACSNGQNGSMVVDELTVVKDGTVEGTYTLEDLEEMPASQAELQGVTYVGVPLGELLKLAGFPASDISAVQAVAADGYSVTYSEDILIGGDVLVAYATANGALSGDDGTFRMVLPGEAGKLNLRMLSELRVETK